MNNFKRINIIGGWLTFVIALAVYALTLEPSVSLWDCGEFISASYRLQVVHPPGAPLFLMLGRLFTIFATPGTHEVAMAVNLLSAVASAATVMFTFWITTHFAKKILKVELNAKSVDLANAIGILGSGLVAALSVTFMDTFWFSAVEAEVYAASSCFMALAFWAILKWECVKDEPTSDRWIVFIAYVVGLGIGLHLLNILVVPAVILYYFVNKFGVNRNNLLKAAGIGLGSIALLQWVIIPKTPEIAAFFDRVFVNSFGLPFNSGVLFFLMLIVAAIIFGLRYTIKNNKPMANLVILCYAFIMLGFSSYSMVVIRSIAEPAINMNDPQDAQSLLSYINREQYGSRPLIKGPYWNAQLTAIDEGGTMYRRGDGEYEEIGTKQEPVYDSRYSTILPRMGDMSEKSQYYPRWSGMEDMEQKILILESELRSKPGDPDVTQKLNEARMTKPTFKNNMTFLFKYQLGWMYWRYFMWNFVGRQNDLQNVSGNSQEGNWISGIKAIDEWRLNAPQEITSQMEYNKARNVYYFLPLILGILGMIVMYKNAKMDFYAVLVMFVFTGLLVVIYLNQPPLEPRERDYTNVGSYQVFCIWIGLSVLFLVDLVKSKSAKTMAAVGATAIALLAAPFLMASQNWDDHDRSDRYLGISFAKNYLASCEKNAILFTNGDNDTYPLWYAQNVEGIRTDVRIINLSLLPTEWYSSALRKKVFDSEALPLSIPAEKIVAGKRDYVRYFDNKKLNQNQFYPLDQVLDYITTDDQTKMQRAQSGELINVFPVQNFSLDIDKAAVIASGYVPPKDYDKIVDKMYWNINRTGLSKGDIVVLDIIATNAKTGWKRPIYWTTTTGSEVYLQLDKYLRHNGLTYQLLPIEAQTGMRGMDDMDLLYDKLMNVYVWGNMDKGTLFLDDKAQLVPQNLRSLFAQVADFHARTGKLDSAAKLMDKCYEAMPESILPLNLRIKALSADIYYRAGQTAKADKILEEVGDAAFEEIQYFNKFKTRGASGVEREKSENLDILRNIAAAAKNYGRDALAKKYEALFAQANTAY
jgi:hypothetical protein